MIWRGGTFGARSSTAATAGAARLGGGFLAALLATLNLAVVPERATAQEWKDISPGDAMLVMAFPGVDPKPEILRRKTYGFQQFFEHGVWRSATGGPPLVELMLGFLSPTGNYYFGSGRTPALGRRIEQVYSGHSIELGSAGTDRNALGEFEYRRFRMGELLECVFMRVFDGATPADGDLIGGDSGQALGQQRLEAWLCEGPGTTLTDETMKIFFGSVGVKGWAVPEPAKVEILERREASKENRITQIWKTKPSDEERPGPARPEAYEVVLTDSVERTASGQKLGRELTEVPMDFGKAYLYARWRGLDLVEHDQALRIYDASGELLDMRQFTFRPKRERWNTWQTFYLLEGMGKPGRWRIELWLDGERVRDAFLEITPAASPG